MVRRPQLIRRLIAQVPARGRSSSRGSDQGRLRGRLRQPQGRQGANEPVQVARSCSQAPLDPGSAEAFKDDEICKKVRFIAQPFVAHSSQFQADDKVQQAISSTVKLSDVKVADYKAVFFVGASASI